MLMVTLLTLHEEETDVQKCGGKCNRSRKTMNCGQQHRHLLLFPISAEVGGDGLRWFAFL